MADEIITERTSDSGNTHTTVIHENRSSNGGGIFIAIVLLVVVGVGLYLFSQSTSSEMAKDNAVTEAAGKIGDAATKVGTAAEDAVDSATK